MARDDDDKPKPKPPPPTAVITPPEAQQAVAPGLSGYPASAPDPTQPGASYASPSGYPASNQLSGLSGPTLASIAASSSPPSAADVGVNQITPVQTAAMAYRALPPDASPMERAAAMQDYRNALSPPMREQMQAFNAAGPDAYNKFLTDKGVNSRSIGSGGALVSASGDHMAVPTVDQEYAARNLAEQGVRRVAAMQQEAQKQKWERDRKGDRTGNAEKGAELEARAANLAKEYGLVDPLHPMAGFNTENAARQQLETGNLARALARDQSTLSSVANRPSVDATQAANDQLSRIAEANNRQAAQDWVDQMARRQAFTYQ